MEVFRIGRVKWLRTRGPFRLCCGPEKHQVSEHDSIFCLGTNLAGLTIKHFPLETVFSTLFACTEETGGCDELIYIFSDTGFRCSGLELTDLFPFEFRGVGSWPRHGQNRDSDSIEKPFYTNGSGDEFRLVHTSNIGSPEDRREDLFTPENRG